MGKQIDGMSFAFSDKPGDLKDYQRHNNRIYIYVQNIQQQIMKPLIEEQFRAGINSLRRKFQTWDIEHSKYKVK